MNFYPGDKIQVRAHERASHIYRGTFHRQPAIKHHRGHTRATVRKVFTNGHNRIIAVVTNTGINGRECFGTEFCQHVPEHPHAAELP